MSLLFALAIFVNGCVGYVEPAYTPVPPPSAVYYEPAPVYVYPPIIIGGWGWHEERGRGGWHR